eukprot:1160695-Pelagomonas_calceolata.AAC.2
MVCNVTVPQPSQIFCGNGLNGCWDLKVALLGFSNCPARSDMLDVMDPYGKTGENGHLQGIKTCSYWIPSQRR